MKKLMTIAAIGGMMCASNALASGFALREQSNAALGNAFAGATAGAEDISYSFYNPAGLTRHTGTQMNLGATLIAPNSSASNATANIPALGGPQPPTSSVSNIVQAAVAPNGYVSHQLDDNWTAALSLNVPFGMITKYPDDWAGRMHGTLSDLKVITATPMLAYKVQGLPQLSLGAGLQVQYITARLRNGVVAGPGTEDRATLTGDALDVGYTLGALYEFDPETRVGVGYRSEVKQKLKGDVRFDGVLMGMNQNIDASLTTPAILTAGIYHDVTDRWAVMAEYGRTFWSSFKNLNVYGESGAPLSLTQENWKDTNFYSVGTSYKLDSQWKLRLGLAYDQSAVNDTYRTPRIPEADRIWYSTGLEYKYSEKSTFNVGYTYIHAAHSRVNLPITSPNNRGSLSAGYQNSVQIFGINYNYAF